MPVTTWLFLIYLIFLLVLPVLVRWQWGLPAALLVVVAELALVFLAHRLMIDHGLLPLVMPDPPPEQPKAKIVAYHQALFTRDLGTQILPTLAVLTGGVLSVAWSLAHLVWRGFRNANCSHRSIR